MDAGDLLVFDSHLMHRSTDNESERIRAPWCTTTPPQARRPQRRILPSFNDWLPARRAQ